MNVFVVKTTVYAPYPLSWEYTIRCSSFSTACARAIKLTLKNDRIRRKRIRQIGVSASKGVLNHL